ncbi:MAG: biotin/lipoyl-binding carrier protein [Chloroflexi bacterium]|nr:MAG: biotin/lipoyl-binding carrier protein [Chloroflexota bacterium]TMD84035.1 MAG: biotin/lipoyl-binding carrier protein [Chloroflexota bacterium]
MARPPRRPSRWFPLCRRASLSRPGCRCRAAAWWDRRASLGSCVSCANRRHITRVPHERIGRVQVTAELTGNLWKIVVGEGQQVGADETLMILESMKMEIPVTAPKAGRVTKIHVHEGQAVQEGQLLAEVD